MLEKETWLDQYMIHNDGVLGSELQLLLPSPFLVRQTRWTMDDGRLN